MVALCPPVRMGAAAWQRGLGSLSWVGLTEKQNDREQGPKGTWGPGRGGPLALPAAQTWGLALPRPVGRPPGLWAELTGVESVPGRELEL